jgi:hypothetical protein
MLVCVHFRVGFPFPHHFALPHLDILTEDLLFAIYFVVFVRGHFATVHCGRFVG